MSVAEDAAMTAVATKATAATYAAAALSGVTSFVSAFDWVTWASIGVAVATAAVNYWYRRSKRADEHAESLQRQELLQLKIERERHSQITGIVDGEI